MTAKTRSSAGGMKRAAQRARDAVQALAVIESGVPASYFLGAEAAVKLRDEILEAGSLPDGSWPIAEVDGYSVGLEQVTEFWAGGSTDLGFRLTVRQASNGRLSLLDGTPRLLAGSSGNSGDQPRPPTMTARSQVKPVTWATAEVRDWFWEKRQVIREAFLGKYQEVTTKAEMRTRELTDVAARDTDSNLRVRQVRAGTPAVTRQSVELLT